VCFSAGASFGAAAVLVGLGGLSVAAAPSRRHLAVAAIPLLFAAQQATEGALWLVLSGEPFGKSETPVGRLFLFFALFLWPSYIPLAFAFIEGERRRRVVLKVMAVGGAIVGGYLFGCATLRPSDTCIAFDNLYYWVQLDPALKAATAPAYASFVVVPLLVSSVRGTTWLAGALTLALAITARVYTAGFISVWCFFAALLSGAVVVLLRTTRRREPGGAAGSMHASAAQRRSASSRC
jgi:hypothetical protein